MCCLVVSVPELAFIVLTMFSPSFSWTPLYPNPILLFVGKEFKGSVLKNFFLILNYFLLGVPL